MEEECCEYGFGAWKCRGISPPRSEGWVEYSECVCERERERENERDGTKFFLSGGGAGGVDRL